MNVKNTLLNYYHLDEWEKAKKIIQYFPDVLKEKLLNRKPILFMAVSDRRHEWVKNLLDLGIDVHVPFKTRYILAEALAKQDIISIRLLVDAGADVNTTDTYGQESLPVAIVQDNLEITQYLIDNGALYHSFEDAEDIQSLEMVELLKKNKHIFTEKGLECWEEEKLALLLKEPKKK